MFFIFYFIDFKSWSCVMKYWKWAKKQTWYWRWLPNLNSGCWVRWSFHPSALLSSLSMPIVLWDVTPILVFFLREPNNEIDQTYKIADQIDCLKNSLLGFRKRYFTYSLRFFSVSVSVTRQGGFYVST